MYILDLQQSRQVLVRESKFVRKAVIKYIDELENKLKEKQAFDLPKTFSEALRMLADSVEREQTLLIENKQQQLQLEQQEPLVTLSNNFLQSKDTISVGEMAKVLYDENIKIGRNRLFELLRVEKLLMKNNIPYQQYIEQGYFDVKEVTKDTKNGTKVFAQTHITPKGQLFITNLVKDKNKLIKSK